MTRTFDGRIFRLEEHVERLYRSLAYLGIDVGLEPKEMIAISEEVVERNEPLRAAAGDWWVAQRISRGVDAIGDEGWAHTGPQVIVDVTPLPLRKRAVHFRDGIDVVVPSIRRTPPSMLSPRAKTHNYLNLILADREVKRRQPRRLVGPPRRARQSLRRGRQQHLRGAGRPGLHPAGAVRAARGEPPDRDGDGRAARHLRARSGTSTSTTR